MQEPTIFTKIIQGEIPAHKVYEDDMTMAFMDIHPLTAGHVLVISKRQVEFVWDLSGDEYRALMDTVYKVAHRLKDVMGLPFVSQRVVGTDIPHAHVHVLPFTVTRELHLDFDRSLPEPDHDALARLAEKLRF